MFLLNRLRNSNREDIRNIVKKLLNEIYSNSNMSNRLLPLRNTLLLAPVHVVSSTRGNIMFKSQNDCYVDYNGFKDPNKFNLTSI
uniref:Uncharacterized protein n=1 Tax=Strongyloides venezuelensis TaxID=75913 RepID=A0A0K0FQE1_STRVS